MEERGYVESEPDPSADDDLVLPRRIYRPTPFGLRVLDAWELMARTIQPEVSRRPGTGDDLGHRPT